VKFTLEIELGERMESPSDVAWALEKVADLLRRGHPYAASREMLVDGVRWTIVGEDGLRAVGFWGVVESD
jgi:hypothetical protein